MAPTIHPVSLKCDMACHSRSSGAMLWSPGCKCSTGSHCLQFHVVCIWTICLKKPPTNTYVYSNLWERTKRSWLMTCNYVVRHGVTVRTMWRSAALYRKCNYTTSDQFQRFFGLKRTQEDQKDVHATLLIFNQITRAYLRYKDVPNFVFLTDGWRLNVPSFYKRFIKRQFFYNFLWDANNWDANDDMLGNNTGRENAESFPHDIFQWNLCSASVNDLTCRLLS